MNEYLVIDIETGDATGVSLDIEKGYVRKGNTKDADKVSKKQEELKAGCLDMSPVYLVGLLSNYGAVEVVQANVEYEGVKVVPCQDEEDLFKKLSQVLSFVPPTVELVSFAGYGFDLPKLRRGFAFYHSPTPSCITISKHFDVQYEMRKVLVKNYAYCSLEEACAKMGVPFEKSIQGAEINAYIEAGRYKELIAYNIEDLWATERLYQKLKGVA